MEGPLQNYSFHADQSVNKHGRYSWFFLKLYLYAVFSIEFL